MQEFLLKKIIYYRDEIESWLNTYEKLHQTPLYLSTDIRDANFKTSVVDSNLFPSGFNNICEVDLDQASIIFKERVLFEKLGAKKILLIIEEHTRNKWYLENVYTLQNIIQKAGFEVIITTSQSEIFEGNKSLKLISEKGNALVLVTPEIVFDSTDHEFNYLNFDFIVLNHDLINKLPDSFQKIKLKTYPSMYAGWHSRLKSRHFIFERKLIQEFCSITQLDPWFFSCLDISVDSVNINETEGRNILFEQASHLFFKIQEKYDEYHIKNKPFIFLKANYGTYGMGVLSINDPSQIKELNRKLRNKLSKGKGTLAIDSYLLQEGVPSIHKVDNMSAEICLYQVANQYIGSFYRIHESKSNVDNLNSPGMTFRSIGRDINAPCGDTLDQNLLYFYQVLSRISGIACMKEIIYLENELLKHEICVSH